MHSGPTWTAAVPRASSKGPFKWEGGTTATYVANVPSQGGRATSLPPHLRWRPTSQRQVGGEGPTSAPNVPTSGGGGGGRCTSTLGRYVGNVRWRGPTFPLQRAFTTGTTVLYHTGTTSSYFIIHPRPFFGCQFPDKTETGNLNLFCKAVVVPTEPGDT